ncbi:NAD(P)H-binding protein [Sphingomonas sp. PAMC 26617]|uniref:NAD(P)H-binding protein n=1 Tax=Sphingomonas sp. PAMC 26617 TaxID=1112216 RepID=UPI0005600A8C|nr:NAD(P)H-binding protein [Sphingomonas sp. PAMC 26617]
MIVVSGATGQLGRAIVHKLVELVPANQIGVSVRDIAKASELQELGIRVRHGDFEKAETLPYAFEGADQILLVSSNAAASGGDPLAQHRAAIDASQAVGAQRIVYTSHISASPNSAFPPARDHAATEVMLRESGLNWTSLRNGFYASSGLFLMGDAPKTAMIEAPADGPVSWTAHDDLAAVAAVILADQGRFDGPTPPLTAAEALDLSDVADVLTKLLHRRVRRGTVSDDEFEAKMTARGAPPSFAKMSLGLYRASRAGEFAAVDPTLERLIGRPPIAMRDVIAAKVISSVEGKGGAA